MVETHLEELMRSAYDPFDNQVDLSTQPSATSPLEALQRHSAEYLNRILRLQNVALAAKTGPGESLSPSESTSILTRIIHDPGLIGEVSESGDGTIADSHWYMSNAMTVLKDQLSEELWREFQQTRRGFKFVVKDLGDSLAFKRSYSSDFADVYAIQESSEGTTTVYLTKAFFLSLTKYELAQLIYHEVAHSFGKTHHDMNTLERQFNSPKTESVELSDLNTKNPSRPGGTEKLALFGKFDPSSLW